MAKGINYLSEQEINCVEYEYLRTSSNLMKPNGNRGSLSSNICFKSFSRAVSVSAPAHPHSLAIFNISVRYEASWRGPVQSGPETIDWENIQVTLRTQSILHCTKLEWLMLFKSKKEISIQHVKNFLGFTLIVDKHKSYFAWFKSFSSDGDKQTLLLV